MIATGSSTAPIQDVVLRCVSADVSLFSFNCGGIQREAVRASRDQRRRRREGTRVAGGEGRKHLADLVGWRKFRGSASFAMGDSVHADDLCARPERRHRNKGFIQKGDIVATVEMLLRESTAAKP